MLYLVILLTLSFGLAEGSLYVLPASSSPAECPAGPCLTLEQYTQESSRYFTDNASFLFLPGSHSLRTPLNLTAVSNISLSFTGTQNGTVTIMYEANITLENVIFFTICGLTFHLQHTNTQEVIITDATFLKMNSTASNRVIIFYQSNISVINCHFEETLIIVREGTLDLIGSAFTKNEGQYGGAIMGDSSSIFLKDNTFTHNSAKIGGAIYCINCTQLILGDGNLFCNNFARGLSDSAGGAIYMQGGNFTATGFNIFSQNSAVKGGAIAMHIIRIAGFVRSHILFENNTAEFRGGAINIEISRSDILDKNYTPLFTYGVNLTFIGNVAKDLGSHENCGALCVFAMRSEMKCNLSATLINNTGRSGGAIYVEKTFGITLYNIRAEGNKDGALGIFYSSNIMIAGTNSFIRNTNHNSAIITIGGSVVKFTGDNTILYNHAHLGAAVFNNSNIEFSGTVKICNNKGEFTTGGLYNFQGTLLFRGITLFCNNTGAIGGAAYFDQGEGKVYFPSFNPENQVHFSNQTNFINNTARSNGGGIFISGTSVYMQDLITFSLNTARSGGAIYLELSPFLILDNSTKLITDRNKATEYGGAIYYQDTLYDVQCRNVREMLLEHSLNLAVPLSFLQVQHDATCPQIISTDDFAGNDGNFLYGGLLDKSRLKTKNVLPYDYFIAVCKIGIEPSNIASKPYQLKLCGSSSQVTNVSIYRGQTFTLQVEAVAQGNTTVPADAIISFSLSARLRPGQSLQHHIPRNCSTLTYNLYSTEKHEILTIYPKGSSCAGIGEGNIVVNVSLRSCPEGFMRFREQCVCDPRLQRLNASCEIDDEPYIQRYKGTKFWTNALHDKNGSYVGLVLSQHCPAEYCVSHAVNFSLDSPDDQCNSHRTGVLCGKCTANFSLLLGGFRCDTCSNMYLLLIIPFALAGVGLVVFLSVTGLTVAIGTINSMILYANIVQVNKAIFFPSNRANPLTVFVAWMNLDFGFQMCFFNGMDIFTQTLLQFAFPVYVWSLILLIIFSSRYSFTVSRLIGSNPVAVLATLLLMSYNKILKVIVDVFSSEELEYPSERVLVWLKDGNLTFLHSKHLLLAVITLLVMVLVFVPYTFLLLLGQWLYNLPVGKSYSWLVIKIKPLLDSYYAPYKKKTRYWTGFLLLVRCSLYAIFSFNSTGRANYSLLAIIMTFTTLGSLTWIHKGLYQFFYLDTIEITVYANLVILSVSAATLPESYMKVATLVLVGIAFATSFGLFLYQIHYYYISKTALWIQLKAKLQSKTSGHGSELRSDNPQLQVSSDMIVGGSIRELREPLLA